MVNVGLEVLVAIFRTRLCLYSLELWWQILKVVSGFKNSCCQSSVRNARGKTVISTPAPENGDSLAFIGYKHEQWLWRPQTAGLYVTDIRSVNMFDTFACCQLTYVRVSSLKTLHTQERISWCHVSAKIH